MGKLKPILLVAIPEIILLMLVYLGVIFKIFRLPIGNITLTIALLTLATFYMILGALVFSNVDIKKLNVSFKTNAYGVMKIVYGFSAGIAMAIFSVGCWEKVLRLPVEKIMILVSLGFLIILVLAAIVVSFKYPRFLLVLLRLAISFILLGAPFFIKFF